MLKKRIESIRRNVDMTSERFRILFSKIKSEHESRDDNRLSCFFAFFICLTAPPDIVSTVDSFHYEAQTSQIC